MKFIINREKFSDIEDAFTRLKANESDISALRKLSDSLKSLTGRNITVNTITPESKNQECSVMSVYPEESTIDALISAIISEQKDDVIGKIWNDTTAWNIEIDTRILSKDVDLSEKELTALILHEVGHIVYSNSVPMKLAKVVRLEYAKSNFVTKQLLKDTLFSKVLCFPILNACKSTKNKESVKAEIQADKYSATSGYKDSLVSAMDKIISYAGSSKTTGEEEMKELMGFSIDSILQLQQRQNALVKKNMGKMLLSTPSKFSKQVVSKFSNSLHGNPNSSVTEDVKDSYIQNKINAIINDFYVSEAFFNRVHKMKRIDPADIDYIGLEINNIRSNDDKMMIVSYIYNKIDTIDYYLALLDSNNPKYVIPHSRESLVRMRDELNKYRLDAINKRLPEVNYGIEIGYPAGYEG